MASSAAGKSRQKAVSNDTDQLLGSAIDVIRPLLKASAVAIGLVDREGQLVVRKDCGKLPGGKRPWRLPPEESLARNCFKTGKPFVFSDVATYRGKNGKALRQLGIRRLLLVPLKAEDVIIGALYIARNSEEKFTRQDIRLANILANQVTMSITSAALLERERKQRQRSDALVAVLAAPASDLTLKKVLHRLAKSVLKLTVAQRCSMMVLGEGSKTVEAVVAVGGRRTQIWESARTSTVVKAPTIPNVMDKRSRRPLIAEDAPNSEMSQEWVRAFGIKSACMYPLTVGRRLVGIMTVYSFDNSVKFPPEEIEAISAVAGQVGVAIHNTRLYERERQQRQTADALLSILSSAAENLSLKKALIKICQSVLDITVGDRCSVILLDQQGKTTPMMSLARKESSDLYQQYLKAGSLFDNSPTTRRFQSMTRRWTRPLIIQDAESSPQLDGDLTRRFGVKSIVHYPLRTKERAIGILMVDSTREKVEFPRDEVKAISTIARQAAMVIENAQLYEQEQAQRRRAEALVGVLSAAASDLSMRKVLVKLCRAVLDLTVGDRCSIFLMGSDGNALEPVMSIGIENEHLWEKFRNPHSSGMQAPQSRRVFEAVTTWEDPIIIEDAHNSPLMASWWVKTFGVKSLVQYPLRVKDKTIGMMVVDAFREQVEFPKEEVDTFAAVAKQAAIIIENARLHEQLQEQAITDPLTGLYNHRHLHERLDEEFSRAARSSQPFALFMMDVDNFKYFNDAYGHPVGDQALRFVADRLRVALRTSDIIGRYGGDEFLAILPETSREEAEQAGRRVAEIVSSASFPVPDSDRSLPLEISVGIGCFPHDSGEKQELLAMADTALYEAKRLGGGRAVPAYAQMRPLLAGSLGFGFLQSILNALAAKDPYTKKHCEENVRYADLLADHLQLPETARESLRKAALLHDVGKIAVPDETLLKPGPLNAKEWLVMRKHVKFGEAIVKGIAQIADAIEPVVTHHERFDGAGYPRGLKGEEIPLLGRILAVVDAYSAMTGDRPYRKALSHENAIQELKDGAGSQFDPEVVEAFILVMDAHQREAKARAA